MKLDDMHQLSKLYPDSDPQTIMEELKKIGVNLSYIYQELEMSSRFVETHMDISYGNAPVHLHSHTFYEMIYCQSNSGTQYLVDTKRYNLQRGDIIIVPPGIGHRPLFPPEMAEPYRRIVLWFSSEFVESLKHIVPYDTSNYFERSYFLRTADTPLEILGNLFQTGLKESHEKKDGWQVALYGNTMYLLTLFIRAMADPQNTLYSSEKPELIDDIIAYIESHLDSKISLNNIAGRFFISESTIEQNFQRKMHVSFYRYVTQRRLIAAKNMILGENNLEDLSHKVGFSDYSTFYRAFKKEYGISPREYRTLITNN